MKKYINYAETTDKFLINWIEKVVSKQNNKNQGEIEHIIDFLKSDSAPKRIAKMSYDQAKISSEKWIKTLQKKGNDIKELPEDIEIILDFKDGMKIVKLINDNAFKREGFLMAHCVGSYCGKDTIYSLRDKNNLPHCTIEWGNQIKGKGNGSIAPKYINYIVEFMQSKDMPMRDSEMENLGYLCVDKKEEFNFLKEHFNDLKFYRNKFIYMEDLK